MVYCTRVIFNTIFKCLRLSTMSVAFVFLHWLQFQVLMRVLMKEDFSQFMLWIVGSTWLTYSFSDALCIKHCELCYIFPFLCVLNCKYFKNLWKKFTTSFKEAVETVSAQSWDKEGKKSIGNTTCMRLAADSWTFGVTVAGYQTSTATNKPLSWSSFHAS